MTARATKLSVRQFGTSEWDEAFALAPDGAGGVMVAGRTQGDLAGPHAGGTYDAFVARYDGDGNPVWIRQFGTSEWDEALALAPDGAGGVMVAGYTKGSLGGPNAGGRHAFLARYDSAGNRVWMRQFASIGSDQAHALMPDGAGGVMIAGEGSDLGVTRGYAYPFVARYDRNGNRLWIRHFGSRPLLGRAYALAPDGAGGVMVAGRTAGDLAGPHAGGNYDAFLARYDGDGNQLWIRQFGTSSDETARALAPDGAGGVMVAGETRGSLGGPHAGLADVFLARYEIDSCYADCDPNGVLDIFDFLCFQNSFVLGEPYACDCDPDPVCDIFDFLCFQNAFVSGCP